MPSTASIEGHSAPSRFTRAARRLSILSHAMIGLGLILVLIGKAIFIQKMMVIGCDGCLYLPIVQHDSIVLGTMLLLYVLSSWLGARRILSVVLRAIVLFIAIVYVVDGLIIAKFSTRLFLADAQEMSSEVRSGYTLVRTAVSGLANKSFVGQAAIPIGMLICLVVAGLFVGFEAPRHSKSRPWLLGASCLLIAFSMVPIRYAFVSSWIYKNVFELNMGLGINSAYPEEFKRTLRDSYRDTPICAPGRHASPNIIVLVVEALSSYQSRYFSGLHDYMPRLDGIARDNTALLDFHANGFRTTGGMISLVAGQFPFPEVGGFRRTREGGGTSLEGFDLGATLPKAVKPAGYTSYYFTTCDLGFSDLGKWMLEAGFDAVEGNESSVFAGLPRYNFDAPPDEGLYKAALQRITSSRLESPYLLVLATTTSHLPWSSPDGGANTEESVMRYVDRQIGDFYDALDKSGFLKNGVLIITGDHRQMTPVASDEMKRFGDAAPAMIPMVVVWKNGSLPHEIHEPYQQIDLVASIRSLVSTESCRSSYQGTFLAPQPAPPRCILHVEGDDRDMIYARCGSAQSMIKMDGARTRIVRGSLPDAKFVIDKINHDRALR